jgi:hypothetical protein
MLRWDEQIAALCNHVNDLVERHIAPKHPDLLAK